MKSKLLLSLHIAGPALFAACLFINAALAQSTATADAGPGPDLPDNPPPAAIRLDPKLPSIFIASDSTAARSSSSDAQGWGEPFKNYFDPAKVNVLNLARGGRSSRTFITEGLWANLLEHVKANDIVLIQFGHNDATAVDSPQARGSLPGLGEETQSVINATTHQPEIVHTLGWYLGKMIADTKAKGATPVLVSLTLHNSWRDGRIERGPGEFAKWHAELAQATGIPFVNLSELEADTFQAMGQAAATKLYRGKTHFGPEAADLHARFVVTGLEALKGKPADQFLSETGKALMEKPVPPSDQVSHQSSWQPATGKAPLALNVLSAPKRTGSLPVVIYLKNLAAPRVGMESDETILADFVKQGYLVATLDFAKDTNARVPSINRDLGKLRDDIRAKKLLANHRLDDAHIFIVPEGCRLKRDVLYFKDVNRPLSLDIIYPSQPKQPVGALLEFSCDNVNRMGNTSLSICSDTILDAFATEGFAVAMADHPVAPPYKGLDPMPDCAVRIKAAARTLRAEGGKLGLNGKIASVGFSRGSGMALMLMTTAGMKVFEGHGENPGVNSEVQGAVVMSGRFTYLDLLPEDPMLPRYAKAWGDRQTSYDVWRRHGALDYLTKPKLPLFLTINRTEGAEALHQMAVLKKRLTALNSGYDFKWDEEPRGHKVTLAPGVLTPMRVYLKERLN